MSINPTSNVNFSSIDEGEIKERGNILPVVSVRAGTHISNSVSPSSVITPLPAIPPSSELGDYPNLKGIVILKRKLSHFKLLEKTVTVVENVLLNFVGSYSTEPYKSGDIILSFDKTSYETSTRWAGAILDEFGLSSRSLKSNQSLTGSNIHDEDYSKYTLRSKNALNDKKTGTGSRSTISKPVFGISDHIIVNNTQKFVIQSLIINSSEKTVVLKMLSAFKDIEDAFASHLPIPPLVEIVRGYCDWTDTGLEKRQEIEKNPESDENLTESQRIIFAAVRQNGLVTRYALSER